MTANGKKTACMQSAPFVRGGKDVWGLNARTFLRPGSNFGDRPERERFAVLLAKMYMTDRITVR